MILISSWTEAPSQYLKVIKSLHEKIKSGDILDSLRPLVVEGFTSKQTKDAMADRWLSMANRIGPEIFLRQTKAILENPNVGQCIPDILCPSLAIAGASDTLLSPDDQFKLLLDPAIFKTVILELCGHNLIWERPLMVSNFVKQWLHLNFESKD
jgi:pimeloyl-ACP methyl ester carboxylesterase